MLGHSSRNSSHICEPRDNPLSWSGERKKRRVSEWVSEVEVEGSQTDELGFVASPNHRQTHANIIFIVGILFPAVVLIEFAVYVCVCVCQVTIKLYQNWNMCGSTVRTMIRNSKCKARNRKRGCYGAGLMGSAQPGPASSSSSISCYCSSNRIIRKLQWRTLFDAQLPFHGTLLQILTMNERNHWESLPCLAFYLFVASSSSHDPYLMRREGVLQEIRHYYRIFVPWSSTGWLPWQVGARFVIYDFWLEYHRRVTLSPPGGNAVNSFVYVTKRQQQWQLIQLNPPPTTQINTTQQSSHAHREW